jgi:hypothetical protein
MTGNTYSHIRPTEIKRTGKNMYFMAALQNNHDHFTHTNLQQGHNDGQKKSHKTVNLQRHICIKQETIGCHASANINIISILIIVLFPK